MTEHLCPLIGVNGKACGAVLRPVGEKWLRCEECHRSWMRSVIEEREKEQK
ncbi:MAG: hypothetical protein KGL39_11990 [Patescibacteria group bacterium]|nr:hypothetical protein [Patescibacteria group bacterium]